MAITVEVLNGGGGRAYQEGDRNVAFAKVTFSGTHNYVAGGLLFASLFSEPLNIPWASQVEVFSATLPASDFDGGLLSGHTYVEFQWIADTQKLKLMAVDASHAEASAEVQAATAVMDGAELHMKVYGAGRQS